MSNQEYTRRDFIKGGAGAAAALGLAGCNNQSNQDSTETSTGTEEEDPREEYTDNGTEEFDGGNAEPLNNLNDDLLIDAYLEGSDYVGENPSDTTETFSKGEIRETAIRYLESESSDGLAGDIRGKLESSEEDYTTEEDEVNEKAVFDKIEEFRQEEGVNYLEDITDFYNEEVSGRESSEELDKVESEAFSADYSEIIGVFEQTRELSESFDATQALAESLSEKDSIENFKTIYGAKRAADKYGKDEDSTVSGDVFREGLRLVDEKGAIESVGEDVDITEQEIRHLGYKAEDSQLPSDPFQDDWSEDGIKNVDAIELGFDPLDNQELFAKDPYFESLEVQESEEDGRKVVYRFEMIDEDEDEPGTVTTEIDFSDWEEYRDGSYSDIADEIGGIDGEDEFHDANDWDKDNLNFTDFTELMQERLGDLEEGGNVEAANRIRDQALVELNRFGMTHIGENIKHTDWIIKAALRETSEDDEGAEKAGEQLMKEISVINSFADTYLAQDEDLRNHTLDMFELAAQDYLRDRVDSWEETFGSSRPEDFGQDEIEELKDEVDNEGVLGEDSSINEVLDEMNGGSGGGSSDGGGGSSGGISGGGSGGNIH